MPARGEARKREERKREGELRELHEETGLRVDDVGGEIGRRRFVLRLTTGEDVVADERRASQPPA